MQEIIHSLPVIAASDSNVLVLGESGTGKELVARALHQHSLRRQGPFCGGELFRHPGGLAGIRAVRA